MLFLYAFGVWLGLAVAAVLNGMLRNSFITPKVGEYAGHVISTIILVCVIFMATYLFLHNLEITCNNLNLLLVGALWVVLTVSFEFVFPVFIFCLRFDFFFQ